MATTIDTLKIAKRWREAKSEDERAEVLAEGLREVQQGQLAELATKADMALLRHELHSETALIRQEIAASHWKTMAGVAVMLAAHLALVWRLMAAG